MSPLETQKPSQLSKSKVIQLIVIYSTNKIKSSDVFVVVKSPHQLTICSSGPYCYIHMWTHQNPPYLTQGSRKVGKSAKVVTISQEGAPPRVS